MSGLTITQGMTPSPSLQPQSRVNSSASTHVPPTLKKNDDHRLVPGVPQARSTLLTPSIHVSCAPLALSSAASTFHTPSHPIGLQRRKKKKTRCPDPTQRGAGHEPRGNKPRAREERRETIRRTRPFHAIPNVPLPVFPLGCPLALVTTTTTPSQCCHRSPQPSFSYVEWTSSEHHHHHQLPHQLPPDPNTRPSPPSRL